MEVVDAPYFRPAYGFSADNMRHLRRLNDQHHCRGIAAFHSSFDADLTSPSYEESGRFLLCRCGMVTLTLSAQWLLEKPLDGRPMRLNLPLVNARWICVQQFFHKAVSNEHRHCCDAFSGLVDTLS